LAREFLVIKGVVHVWAYLTSCWAVIDASNVLIDRRTGERDNNKEENRPDAHHHSNISAQPL
jgi:hypothetical protein